MKNKKNNLVKKYNMSLIMTRAWKLFAEIPLTDRVDESFSLCLTLSWKIAKNGLDSITFEQVYKKHYKEILYFVNKTAKSIEDAEDITSLVFEKLHRLFDSYDVHKAKVRTYLYVIAKTKTIDFYRTDKQDNYINVGSYVDDEGKDMFQFVDESKNECIENEELHNSINKALCNLKPKYKEIAELYFIKELKYDEISKMLDMPMGTVKGMINRCRTKLQENLKDVRTKDNAII